MAVISREDDLNPMAPPPRERVETALPDTLPPWRNVSWVLFGNVVHSGFLWGCMVLMARTGGPAMIGQWALAWAICTPIIMFARLHLRTLLAADARHEFPFGAYLGLTLFMAAPALLATGCVVIVSGYDAATALVIGLVFLMNAFESISEIFYGLFQLQDQLDRVGKSLALRGGLSFALFTAGLAVTGSLVGGLVGMTAGWGLVLVSYDLRQGTQFAGGDLLPCWGTLPMPRLLALSLPVGVVTTVIALNSCLPRYFLESSWGPDALGVFSAIATLMVPGSLIATATSQVAIPRLARSYLHGRTRVFAAELLWLLVLGIVLGAAAVLVAVVGGSALLGLIFGPAFGEHADLFLWMMVAVGPTVVNCYLGAAVNAMRLFRIQLPIHLVINGLVLPLSWWLIQTYGLRGGAWTLLVSSLFFVLVYGGLVAWHLVGRRPQRTPEVEYPG